MQHQRQFETQLQQGNSEQENQQQDYRNPYNPVLVPALPDMQALPAGLANFRYECAAGE
jgi:hypothetical protein